MPALTSDDFYEVETREDLDGIMATGFVPSGTPGTAEHALNVAEALEFADGDIFYDFDSGASTPGECRAAAATSANLSSLQAATGYAASLMRALARNPDLLGQVQAALDQPDVAPSP